MLLFGHWCTGIYVLSLEKLIGPRNSQLVLILTINFNTLPCHTTIFVWLVSILHPSSSCVANKEENASAHPVLIHPAISPFLLVSCQKPPQIYSCLKIYYERIPPTRWLNLVDYWRHWSIKSHGTQEKREFDCHVEQETSECTHHRTQIRPEQNRHTEYQ